ncbi:hypothetical protein [Alysiella crassa]|uniref:Lipoprotein n=1 Tax=Alysiella crassa TaxID=153491 RepID=A0A376BW75_9NEIS|nr:hypothetical protein [Alysiella crassa]UOP06558.1 hypothetical protein LVJ80_12480 [Alysiella crassa]SSY81091.1 Uncharacterised protein [Alysiella crassa]
MKHYFIAIIACATLVACQPEKTEEPEIIVKPNLSVSAPIMTVAASVPAVASSPIVAQILSASEEADIITSSKQAMANVSASEIAAASALAASVETVYLPEDDLPEVKLPEVCERYYKRVDACFAKQSENSEELRMMNQEARVDLATDKPTDSTCEALNKSFNGVAQNLGCE